MILTKFSTFCEYEYLRAKFGDKFDDLAASKQFERNIYIYLPTDNLESLYVIKSGVVKLGGYSPTGDEVTYDVVGPGEFFGNLKYLGGGYFSEFAKSLTPVRVVAYNLKFFKKMIAEDQTFHHWFTRIMVMRWARAESRLFRISSMKPEQRLEKLITELDRLIAAESSQKFRTLDVLTQKDIADLGGMTRQTAAKFFRQTKGELPNERRKLQ